MVCHKYLEIVTGCVYARKKKYKTNKRIINFHQILYKDLCENRSRRSRIKQKTNHLKFN